MKYGDNSATGMVVASGNQKTMGKIISVNLKAQMLLGYDSNQLINRNVRILTPNIIARVHDGIMRRYFKTGKAKFVNKERTVYPLRSSGYVTPCSALLRVMPTLEQGVQLVLFVNELEVRNFLDPEEKEDPPESLGIILFGDDGSLYGVTKEIKRLIGVKAKHVLRTDTKDQVVNLEQICPKILEKKFNKKLMDHKTVFATFDTKILYRDFDLVENSSSNHNAFDANSAIDQKSNLSFQPSAENFIPPPEVSQDQDFISDFEKAAIFAPKVMKIKLLARESYYDGSVVVNTIRVSPAPAEQVQGDHKVFGRDISLVPDGSFTVHQKSMDEEEEEDETKKVLQEKRHTIINKFKRRSQITVSKMSSKVTERSTKSQNIRKAKFDAFDEFVSKRKMPNIVKILVACIFSSVFLMILILFYNIYKIEKNKNVTKPIITEILQLQNLSVNLGSAQIYTLQLDLITQ